MSDVWQPLSAPLLLECNVSPLLTNSAATAPPASRNKLSCPWDWFFLFIRINYSVIGVPQFSIYIFWSRCRLCPQCISIPYKYKYMLNLTLELFWFLLIFRICSGFNMKYCMIDLSYKHSNMFQNVWLYGGSLKAKFLSHFGINKTMIFFFRFSVKYSPSF